MAINYDLYQNPSPDGSNKQMFARPISNGTIDTNELIDQISVNEGFIDVGEARKIVTKVCEAIKRSIADGYSVHINEFGFFSPKLSTTWPDDQRRNTPDVTLDGIRFTTEKEVKDELSSVITNQVVKLGHTYKQAYTDDQLDAILTSYLDEHVTITRPQLQSAAVFLSKTTACAYLNRCVERGLIRNVGSRNSPVYMKC